MRNRIKIKSFFWKLVIPFTIAIVLFAGIISGTIYFGDTIKSLERNAVDVLRNTTKARASHVRQNIKDSADIEDRLLEVIASTAQVLGRFDESTFDEQFLMQLPLHSTPQIGKNSITDLGNPEKPLLTAWYLKEIVQKMVPMLWENSLSGVYFILENGSDENEKHALHVRWPDGQMFTPNFLEAEYLIAPVAVTNSLFVNPQKQELRKERLNLEENEEFVNMYRAVIDTAKTVAQSAENGAFVSAPSWQEFMKRYALFSPRFDFVGRSIISYNVPLMYGGVVYGLLGIEICAEEIISKLNHFEIANHDLKGSYIIAQTANETHLNTILHSGTLFDNLYQKSDLAITEKIAENFYRLENGKGNVQVYTLIQTLDLYEDYSFYADSSAWVIASVIPKRELFDFPRHFSRMLGVNIGISLIFGLLISVGISLLLSYPVRKLAKTMKGSEKMEDLGKTNIYEIDELVGEIKSLAVRVKESELASSRIDVMLSQIRPHFLYNSLVAIQELCLSDPALASEMIQDFAQYLRGNMESLKIKELVPFDRELKHIEKYLSIEQKRFGERLKIVYDMQVYDFNLPVLTVQPLAENAVRHGVMKRDEGGTVWISTAEDEAHFVITVKDNGMGMVAHSPSQNGNQSVGLKNVRERLDAMCGGTLEITSEWGIGTTAVVKIPKNRGQA
ncbi:MAG: histidine kinase [Firmicutes bacterium]|nr:histidine kinase [Bacillota bacterium]